ncbi:MAG: LON peptidase substrate-binding domain-containing protein [Candidatus Acidiferrales bacterium]
MDAIRIPLFPLPLVLFPNADLPLHIFEPRYKQMVHECIVAQTEFGVVLAREQGVAKIGCAAEVIETTREYPDGRMDIMVQGRSAFEVVEIFQEKPYFEAAVRYLSDEGDPKSAVTPARLLETYARCHTLLFGGPPDEIDRQEIESIAFLIANELPLELEDKQTLLMLRDENERLARLLPMIEQLLPRAESRYRARQKASGNGHAHA